MGSSRFLDEEITLFLESYGWYAILLFFTWYVLKGYIKSYIDNGLKKISSTETNDLKRKKILDEEMKRIRKLQSQQ